MTENDVAEVLISLGVIDPSSVELYSNCVRDRDDIAVLRCRRSGVIFLNRSSQSEVSYYEAKDDDSATVQSVGQTISVSELEDVERRSAQFSSIVRNKRWLDFGTGRAGILDKLGPLAAEAVGIEPNNLYRTQATRRGLRVQKSIDELSTQKFDITTLFHVFEHLNRPIETLKRIASRMVPTGLIIIEVPHANDILLKTYNSEPFKLFTLWSEHLVLHTRESLRALIEAAGLHVEAISGYQRYPISNHLFWLRHGEPGGHSKWSFLNEPALNEAYAAVLGHLDMTDTLIAQVRV